MTEPDQLAATIAEQIRAGVEAARAGGAECSMPTEFSLTVDGVEHRYHIPDGDAQFYVKGSIFFAIPPSKTILKISQMREGLI